MIPHFYVSATGETRGPTTLPALLALLRAKAPDVTEQTLVWRDGIEWTPLVQLIDEASGGAGQASANPEPTVTVAPNDTVHNESELGEDDEDELGVGQQQTSATTKRSKRRKRAGPANCSVYVEGLPKDVSENEVFRYFSRCGFIRKDDNKPRIKLYKNHETGELKGDAVITYISPESVFLAIQQFDDSDFRVGCKVHVKEANFSQQLAEQQQQESHKRITTQDEKQIRAKKVRKLQERALLSWNEDSYTTKEAALLIVVLKGMFDPSTLEDGREEALAELEQDLIEGLAPICPAGDEIKKITVFKSHPQAVILIRFKDAVTASSCVELMNGRFFDGRRIEATLWDGVTEYAPQKDVEKRMDDEARRMEAYDQWLEQGGQSNGEEEEEDGPNK